MSRTPRPGQTPLGAARAAAYKLHLGHGTRPIGGWLNLDADQTRPDAAARWDPRRRLPVDDRSCTLVYAEHVLELLGPSDGQDLLVECQRVLKPGGVLRLALAASEPTPPGGRQWWQDKDEVQRRLLEAGFGFVREVPPGKSPLPALAGLEARADAALICEAIL